MGIAARAAAPETLKAVTCPVLLLHAIQDSIASPDAARCVFGEIPSLWKRAVWLENSDHVIFWDHEREKVAEEVLSFLDRIDRNMHAPAPAAPQTAVIRRISATEARPLRHAMLRQGKPFASTVWTGDDEESTAHFGAFDGDVLVGVASIYVARPPGETGNGFFQMRGMAVMPEWRGKGIGAALSRACLDHVRQPGVQCVWCNARAHARGFYERLGFKATTDMFEIEGIGPHYQMRRYASSLDGSDRSDRSDMSDMSDGADGSEPSDASD